MADYGNDFQRLMEGVRNGSEVAAWEIVNTYGEPLRRAVRRVLHHKLRSKFDSIDFVQLVWKSFFCINRAAQHYDRPEQLTAFLGEMARNKVRMETRKRLNMPGYNVRREQTLDDDSVDADLRFEGGQRPLPIDVAIARERWNQLVQDQPEHNRKIIGMKLSGHSCRSISVKLHLDEETVRRFLKKLLLVSAKP